MDQLPGIPGNRPQHQARTKPDLENRPFFRVDRDRLLQAVFFVSGPPGTAGEGGESGNESGKSLAVAGSRTKMGHDRAPAPAA